MKNMDMQRCDDWSERPLSDLVDPRIAELEAANRKLRAALVVVVGVDDPEMLRFLKDTILRMPGDFGSKAILTCAIHALLEVPKL